MLCALVHELCKLVGLRPLGDHQELGAVVIEAGCRQGIPDALCHERHDRVQEPHRDIEDIHEVALDLQLLLGRAIKQAALAELDVPVADLTPEEALEIPGVVAEVVGLELLGSLCNLLGKAGKHPGILCRLCLRGARRIAVEVHLHEAGSVPDLRDKGACLLGTRRVDELSRLLVDVGIELDVLVRRDERQKVEAHSVSAVLLDEVHRVHAVALGLGHAAAILGKDRGVDVDVVERNLVREVERAHDHAGNPEGNDVAGGHEDLGRMMPLHLLRMVRPALCREGPELRGEPGVEDILILMDVLASALRAHLGVLHEGVFPAAVVAVEDRNPVAPPELAGDAPILEVVHPGKVGLRPAGRMELDFPIAHDLSCTLLELVHSHEPLLGEPGLERRAAAVAVHDGMAEFLDVVEQAVAIEPVDDSGTGLIAVHAGELAVAIHNVCRLIENVDLRQIVRLAHGIVIRVMCRRDFHEASAVVCIDVPVGEDRNLAVHDRKHHGLADKLLLLGVLRRHGNARIAEHRLRTGRCDRDVLDAIHRLGQRITEVPQMALLVLVLCLVVGDGGTAGGAPVHDALAAVDEAIVVPVAEDLPHGTRELGAHRELLVGEVDGAAHSLDLADDCSAVLMRPVPAGLDEFLAAHLETVLALTLELLVHLGLGCDTCMVRAQDPPRGAAPHAVVANERILDGVVHCMSHVEDSRHIGGRDNDGAVAYALASLVAACIHPLLDELRLMLLGIVGLRHLFHSNVPSDVSRPTALALVY